MEIIYSPKAIEDINFWRRSGNKDIMKRSRLLEDILIHPFTGMRYHYNDA
jgi:toxin YoeB